MRAQQVEATPIRKVFTWGLFSLPLALSISVWIQACAPARTSRSSLPSTVSSAPSSSPPKTASLSPKTQEPQTKPVVEQGKIKEEDLKEKRSAPQARSRDQRAQPARGRESPPLPDDSSLIAKITPRTSPQRAASLRLTEEGKKLLDSGDYTKALSRLEKTIAIDSTNPYGYYYLAKAHYHMTRYQESLNFLDVAESLFASEPYWLAEVFALKGENFRALGFVQQADSSYSQALKLNPGNRMASDGLGRLQGEAPPNPR